MSRTLEGRTILITRSSEQAEEFRLLLEELGARVIEFSTIEVRPRPDAELDRTVARLGACDWILFTSANAARILLGRAKARGSLSAAAEAAFRICAVGPATARTVASFGLDVALVPDRHQAEGVLNGLLELHQGQLEGLRFLLPRASQARDFLPVALKKEGAAVEVHPVYDNVVPERSRGELLRILASAPPDVITFTSSSTVKNFVALAGDLEELRKFPYAVIGPITAETAGHYGLRIVAQPSRSTIPDLAAALAGYFKEV